MPTNNPRLASPNSPLPPKGWRPRPAYEPSPEELRQRIA